MSGKFCPTCGTEYPLSERFCPRDGTALRSQDATADLVGSVIAERYHVIRKLGAGGMGAVYLAEHVKMGRKSAIKVMNPGMSENPDAIARFNREASNASRMNHPNICAIYDFGETPEGLIYLAMEFIEGRSLTDVVNEQGSLPPARAAAILSQTADALQVAHDYGIVHRDLKPDNIMIAKGREDSDLVKVVDFGIAKAHSSEAQKVTKTGLVVGTPEYMSPEQLAGDNLDGRSDIYSLALVGFNMLTGVLPFPAQTAQETMIMRLTDDPKKLSEMKSDVAWSAALESVMAKALARDANDRYQKAPDFARDFARAVESMPVTMAAAAGTMVVNARASAATTAIPRTRVSADGSSAPTPAPARAKSNTMPMVFGGIAVAAIAVAIVLNSGMFSPAVSDPDPNGSPPFDTISINPPPDEGGARGGGGTVDPQSGAGRAGANDPGRSTQRGKQMTPPPVTVTDPGRSGATQDTEAAELRRELNRLESLSLNASTSQHAVFLAETLYARTQGETRVELLLRRAEARGNLNQYDLGCQDIKIALDSASANSVYRSAIAVLRSALCN